MASTLPSSHSGIGEGTRVVDAPFRNAPRPLKSYEETKEGYNSSSDDEVGAGYASLASFHAALPGTGDSVSSPTDDARGFRALTADFAAAPDDESAVEALRAVERYLSALDRRDRCRLCKKDFQAAVRRTQQPRPSPRCSCHGRVRAPKGELCRLPTGTWREWLSRVGIRVEESRRPCLREQVPMAMSQANCPVPCAAVLFSLPSRCWLRSVPRPRLRPGSTAAGTGRAAALAR